MLSVSAGSVNDALMVQVEETEVQRERDLRSQLSRQAAAHSDHVKEVLRVQQHELQTAFDVRLAGLIDKERTALHQKIAAWTGRLQGIEKALTGALLSLFSVIIINLSLFHKHL